MPDVIHERLLHLMHVSCRKTDRGSAVLFRHRSSNTSFSAETSVTTLQNPALSLERKKELIEGARFNKKGRSTSKMTYSFFTEQDGNAWVFNYHPFYAWNGCSNQAFAAPLFGKFFDVLEYYLCPIGALTTRRIRSRVRCCEGAGCTLSRMHELYTCLPHWHPLAPTPTCMLP